MGYLDGIQGNFPSNPGAILAWLAISALSAFSIWIVFTAIYNVYFHPLRKFPGPWLAKATRLPYIWRLANGRMVNWTNALHRQYGDVVRTQPDELSFTTASAWKDIFACRPQLPKPENQQLVNPNGTSPIGTTDTQSHDRQRQILNYAFSDRALKEQEYILQNYSNFFIRRLHEQAKPGTEIDICNWFNFLTFDIIGDLLFAESFNSLIHADHHPWVNAILKSLKTAQLLAIFSLLPPLGAILQWSLPQSVKEKVREHFQFSLNQVEKRLAKKTNRPDIMRFILENNHSKGMTRNEIESTADMLVIAGSETSAQTMSAATWFCLKNPKTMERLQQEVRSSFERADQIDVASVSKLPYLEAILKETMRLHPAGPLSVPRYVDRPVHIAGHFVPPGARVGVPHKTASRLDSKFADAGSFVPERWLPEADPKYHADDKELVQPFGVGPRNCIGKSLAWAEMRLIMTKVIWAFDLELTKNNLADWSDRGVWLLHEQVDLNVRLKPTNLP